MGAMPDRAAPRTGGRLIADALGVHGVETVFCVPGESYLEIMDGLYDLSNEIALISCRHEHCAANMAEAYGKLTGWPGGLVERLFPGRADAARADVHVVGEVFPLAVRHGAISRSRAAPPPRYPVASPLSARVSGFAGILFVPVSAD